MTSADLDPLFVRALRLLHSKTKESEQQLKALLDESIRQRKAGLPINIPAPLTTSSSGSGRGRETEKNLNQLKRDLTQQLVPGASNAKKLRLEVGGNTRISSNSLTPSPTTSVPVEESDDMDLDFQSLNDCTCCICKSFNQENGNKLMECHTCQNLYHQECHSPVITDQEANDPRLVWNCSNCSATLHQPTVLKPAAKSSSKSGASHGSRAGSSTSSKDKRNEPSKTQSQGMTGLAAAFSGTSKASSSSSSSRGSANVPATTSASTIATADKRLQMMKKKAAAASSSSTSTKKGK